MPVTLQDQYQLFIQSQKQYTRYIGFKNSDMPGFPENLDISLK
jgi:hypothetical protein